MPSCAIGYPPFFMVYDAEAVLPTDLDYGSPRIVSYNEQEAKATSTTLWSNSTRHATSRSSTRQSTSRPYIATTAGTSKNELSALEIWCSLLSKATGTSTTSPLWEGPFLCCRSPSSRDIPPRNDRRQDDHQCVEHRTIALFLPLKSSRTLVISTMLFVKYPPGSSTLSSLSMNLSLVSSSNLVTTEGNPWPSRRRRTRTRPGAWD